MLVRAGTHREGSDRAEIESSVARQADGELGAERVQQAQQVELGAHRLVERIVELLGHELAEVAPHGQTRLAGGGREDLVEVMY